MHYERTSTLYLINRVAAGLIKRRYSSLPPASRSNYAVIVYTCCRPAELECTFGGERGIFFLSL